jgi:hypothetical protein
MRSLSLRNMRLSPFCSRFLQPMRSRAAWDSGDSPFSVDVAGLPFVDFVDVIGWPLQVRATHFLPVADGLFALFQSMGHLLLGLNYCRRASA